MPVAPSQKCLQFLKRLAWCLRLWLLLLPAGVGLATARACVRLWFCISPQKSGIYSAGNGPAMRVAPIGAFFAHNRGLLDQYVAASTLLTHTDPKALTAARAVALVTALAAVQDERPSLAKYLDLLTQAGQDEDWQHLLTKLDGSLQQAQSTVAFAKTLGLERGVSGYSYHTVPVVLHAVYRYWHDFESGLIAILACGGDADTTAAIGGAILGTIHGKQGIPLHWRNGLRDWPRGARYFDALANSLAQGGSPVRYPWWGVLPRNICFLKIVLAHGLRRLLPPY